MTTGALIFLASSWAGVLGLTFWSYGRILHVQRVRKNPPPAS